MSEEGGLETGTWKAPSKMLYKPRRRYFIHDWTICRVPGGGNHTLWAEQTPFSPKSVQQPTSSLRSLQQPSPRIRSNAPQLPGPSATLHPPRTHVTPRASPSRNPNPIVSTQHLQGQRPFLPYRTSSASNRHHASRSLRYQAVHRDLPPEGCLLYVPPLLVRLKDERKRIGEPGIFWLEPRKTDPSTPNFSRPDQAQPQEPADQVQGPLRALRLHPRPDRLR